jgi:hypothetical protein
MNQVIHFTKPWLRWTLPMLLCVLLSGCFFLPGKFASHLDIRRDGTYTFSYAGELVFAFPESTEQSWTDTMAHCFAIGSSGAQPCTQNEITQRKAEFEMGQTARRAQAEEFATLTGYNPYDREANEEIARKMTGYQGWKTVTYIGNGIFDVDYEMSGKVDRDIIFPMLPHAQLTLPFLNIRHSKTGGILEVDAPALSTTSLRSILREITGVHDDDDMPMLKHTEGTFVLTTDAELTYSNGEVRKDPKGHAVEWRINGTGEKLPHAQLALEEQATAAGGD